MRAQFSWTRWIRNQQSILMCAQWQSCKTRFQNSIALRSYNINPRWQFRHSASCYSPSSSQWPQTKCKGSNRLFYYCFIVKKSISLQFLYMYVDHTMFLSKTCLNFYCTKYLIEARAPLQDASHSGHLVVVFPAECLLYVLYQRIFGPTIHADASWDTYHKSENNVYSTGRNVL